MPDRLICSS